MKVAITGRRLSAQLDGYTLYLGERDTKAFERGENRGRTIQVAEGPYRYVLG